MAKMSPADSPQKPIKPVDLTSPIDPVEIPPEVAVPVTDEQLLERLGAVLSEATDIRSEMVKENRKRDIRIRNSRILIALSMLVAVISVGVGRAGVVSANKAKDALNRSLAETQVARIASCQNSNVHEAQQAKIEIGESHDQIALFVSAAAGSPNADQAKILEFVNDYNHRHDTKIKAEHRDALRDCSPAGITRYLTQHKA